MTSSSSRQYVSSYSARRTLQARRIFFSCDKCDLFLCTALHASFALCAYFRSHMRFFISAFRLLHHPAECYETYALTYLCGFSPCTVFRRVLNPLSPELNSICYLLALLAHHFLHVSRIRVKLLTFRLLTSYIYIWSTYS